jgi:hypothetical protein
MAVSRERVDDHGQSISQAAPQRTRIEIRRANEEEMIAAIDQFKPHGRIRAALMAFLVVSGLAISAMPAAAVTRTPYNTNLVKNSGFEMGSASVDGSQPVAVPGWTTSLNTTVVAYGTPGFPTKHDSAQFGGRHQFLTLGQADSEHQCGQAVQTIALRGRAADIDASAIRIWFKARVGTSASEPDLTGLSYRFVPAPSEGNSSADFDVTTSGSMEFEGQSQILPPGTRSIEIVISATDTDGSCAAYFDKVKVVLLHA